MEFIIWKWVSDRRESAGEADADLCHYHHCFRHQSAAGSSGDITRSVDGLRFGWPKEK